MNTYLQTMEFSIKTRDGPARIGNLIVEGKSVVTPNILFINTSRFNPPIFANIFLTNDNQKIKKPTIRIGKSAFSSFVQKDKKKCAVNNYLIYPKDVPLELHVASLGHNKKNNECCILPANKDVIDDILKDNFATIFIISNASQLLSQQSKFIEFITEIRNKIGYQRMIYLPAVGQPSSLALLAYMGIDLFDSISAIISARNEILLFPTGNLNKKELTETPCSCPSCSMIKGKASELLFSQILNHNYFALIDELKLVRNAIALGNLRELVETRVRSNPNLVSILKILDFQYYNFLEERTPIIRKSKLLVTSKESLYRPEVKRFQERVISRFHKPISTKVLLLLPCSAKKPYLFSKSHKLFRERIFQLRNPHAIHEVIITSPLGIVPRELELVYPASMYDIAVTGHWDEDEKKIIRNLLKKYLEMNVYDKVVLHVPSNIRDFIIDLIDKPIITCIDKPTSKESLNELSKILMNITRDYEKVSSIQKLYENILTLACYQFGEKIAELLLKNCKIKGKYPYQKIIDNGNQLGMITKERGFISLTMEGAKKIAHCGEYWVEIYDDFTPKGSIFAPGIKDADETIRIGDEVIVLQNKKMCAVGVAQMNGTEMKETDKGEAVKTRHII